MSIIGFASLLSQTLELPQFSNLLIGPATAGLELYLPILDTHHPHFGHPFRCSTISLRGCFDPPSGTGGTTPQPFWTHFGHPSPSFWTPRLLDCFSRVYNVQISFSLTNDPAPAGSFWTIWTPLCRIILNPFSHEDAKTQSFFYYSPFTFLTFWTPPSLPAFAGDTCPA